MFVVKSTVNISKYNKEQLEYLVQIKELSSVTEGINLAISEFVKAKQKSLYAAQMQEAAQDDVFMNRTMSSQKDFEKIDGDTNYLSGEDQW